MKLALASSLALAFSQLVAATASPVEKVVTLLQELKQRLESDGSDEQAAFDRYACWCEETTAGKGAAIEANRAQLSSLGQEILTQRSVVAEKTIEVKEGLAEIEENEQAQQQATTIRQKENAAYSQETTEMKEAIDALERATIVLRDASQPALLQHGQEGGATMQKARLALTDLSGFLAAAPERLLAKVGNHKEGAASALQLLDRYTESLHGGNAAKYVPQSLTIQGILKDLYHTFAVDLEGTITEEAEAATAYENLIATKQTEVIQLQEKVKKAEKAKAEAETMLTEALQTYDDTEAQLKDDVAFFDATKTACTSKAEQWATRKSLRAEQLGGVTEALSILSSDEARELFNKAISPGVGFFLQLATANELASGKPAQKAIQALKQHAAKAHSLRLAGIAAKVQAAKVGHFDQVIAAIDAMIGVLKKEGADDIIFRDHCRKTLHDIESKIQDLTWKVKVNDAKISKLEELIEKLEALETKTIEDIGKVNQTISDLTSTRTQENADFQAAKEDDVKAVQLLTQAKDVLASYYANHSIDLGPTESGKAALLEVGNSSGVYIPEEEPDMDFAHKGKRKHESKGIIALLETIIEDLNTEIANGVRAEEAAQLEYEAQMKAAEDLQATLIAKKANLASDIALRKDEKTDEEGQRTTNQNDLDDEVTDKEGMEPTCEEAKFQERTTKRAAEMEGLVQAKEFLAGYQESQSEGADAAGSALLAEAKRPKNAASLRGLAPVGRHAA